MKGIINIKLQNRIKGPDFNPMPENSYHQGDEVEIIDLVNSDEYEGIKSWYQLSDGNYVWAGGVEGVTPLRTPQEEISQKKTDYNKSFVQIPEAYRNKKGKNIRIAVLDSGINMNHLAFQNAVSVTHNSSNSSIGINDVTGHGSHCAGIIGARNHALMGLAPQSKLLISKVISDQNIFTSSNFIQGLDWAINTANAQVINISIGLDSESNAEIIQLLNRAIEKKIVIVASAGENSMISETFNGFWYPAMYDQCISVGAISKVFLKNNPNPSFNSKLDYLMPYNFITSCSNIDSEYYEERGSSMASAFISAAVALIKASVSDPDAADLNYVKSILNQFATTFIPTSSLDDSLFIFKP